MPGQLEPPDYAVGVDADQDVDRLSGIAYRTGEVGVEIDISRQFVALINGGDGRVALQAAETIGAFEYLGRLSLLQEFRQLPCCRGRNWTGQEHNGCQRDRHQSDDRAIRTPDETAEGPYGQDQLPIR
ncbi:hypothetical protein ACN2CC_03430 [Mesorhizobium muleiense]|uniref:hypothetical protein n=1 Tax=Mesorhizobium muleiense TaxID=1004279 RepID=UPI003AFAF315